MVNTTRLMLKISIKLLVAESMKINLLMSWLHRLVPSVGLSVTMPVVIGTILFSGTALLLMPEALRPENSPMPSTKHLAPLMSLKQNLLLPVSVGLAVVGHG